MRFTLEQLAPRYRVRTAAGTAIRTSWQTTLADLAEYQVAVRQGDIAGALGVALAPDLDQTVGDPADALAAFIVQFQAPASASGDDDEELDLPLLFARLSARYGYREWWREPYPMVLQLADHLAAADTLDRIIGWEAAHADQRTYGDWHRDVTRRGGRRQAAPTHITRDQFIDNAPLDVTLIPRPQGLLPHEILLAQRPDLFSRN